MYQFLCYQRNNSQTTGWNTIRVVRAKRRSCPVSSEFRFLETSLLDWCLYWKEPKPQQQHNTPKSPNPPAAEESILSRWSLGWAQGMPVTCQPSGSLRAQGPWHSWGRDTRATRASTGAEQGHPRPQSFRLQGDKSPAVPFWGPCSGAPARAVCCYCSVTPLFKWSRGLRLCWGELGVELVGRKPFLWVCGAQWDLLGHGSHLWGALSASSDSLGWWGCGDRVAPGWAGRIITWAWLLTTEIVLGKVSCLVR